MKLEGLLEGEGICTSHFRDGGLEGMIVGTFRNGQLNGKGEEILYFSSGDLAVVKEGNFTRGEMTSGEVICYDRNNKIKSIEKV